MRPPPLRELLNSLANGAARLVQELRVKLQVVRHQKQTLSLKLHGGALKNAF